MMMGETIKAAEETVFGWAVVLTKKQQEKRAMESLEQKGFTVYMPQTLKTLVKGGLVRTFAWPVFPGYLFVKLSPATPRWWAVLHAMGVASVLGVRPGDYTLPLCLRDEVLERLRQREEAGYIKIAVRSAPPARPALVYGQKVGVVGGLWDQFELIFTEAVDEKRAMILASCLTRSDSPLKLFVKWTDIRPND